MEREILTEKGVRIIVKEDVQTLGFIAYVVDGERMVQTWISRKDANDDGFIKDRILSILNE